MSRSRDLLLRLSRWQPFPQRGLSTQSIPRAKDSASSASDSTVALSQVVRYALSGDPEAHSTTVRRTPLSTLNHELELILSKRQLSKPRQKGRLISLPGGPRVPAELREVSDLQELKLWFEQYIIDGLDQSTELTHWLKSALVNCERSSSSLEILSILTVVKTRHVAANVDVPEALLKACLYYACQSFSVPTIRFHLASVKGKLDPKFIEELTQCLLRTLQNVCYADPAYDTRPWLELMGEDCSTTDPEVTLLKIIPLSEGNFSPLIELLCELGASKVHKEIWDKQITFVKKQKRSPDDLASHSVEDAYKSILVFLKSGMTDYAMSCMNGIGKVAPTKSPSLSLSTELAAVLNENGLKVPAVIEEPIQKALSQALEQQDSASPESSRFDNYIADFSVVQSLLGSIKDKGTSVSASEIALLIDSLNSCAGLLIPLFVESFEDHDMEYAWSPQWNPGVSDSSNVSFFSQGSQTLGLLRAQITNRGIIVNSERSRNLLQLGHLVARRSIMARTEDYQTTSWANTGYLVGFDRISAEYLLIFMGENMKIIDPEYRPRFELGTLIEHKRHPLLGPLSLVAMPNSVEDLQRDISEVVAPVENAASRYFVDLDSGFSLRP